MKLKLVVVHRTVNKLIAFSACNLQFVKRLGEGANVNYIATLIDNLDVDKL